MVLVAFTNPEPDEVAVSETLSLVVPGVGSREVARIESVSVVVADDVSEEEETVVDSPSLVVALPAFSVELCVVADSLLVLVDDEDAVVGVVEAASDSSAKTLYGGAMSAIAIMSAAVFSTKVL